MQAIRAYIQGREPDLLLSEMGVGAGDIAEVVPEIKVRLPEIEAPPPLENPEQARFRLFDSITTFLKNASRSQPAVLLLDDLHWVDKPSLLLLEFLTRELAGSRLLIVGTYRDTELSRQHPLSESLAQLSREPALRRVLLRGLSYEDTGRFIEVNAGVQPSQRLMETIHTRTEGNPFFMSEVVRLLVEQGGLTSEEVGGPDSIRVPEGVREVIGQRLNRLSERCNQVLTTASVIGREFGLAQLDRLIEEMSEDALLEALEETVRAHVIEEVSGEVGRYQFAHALIQHTLAEELSSTRRARLHARVAEVLEDMYEVDVESHASELAYHFAEAETVLGTEKLVRYSLLAGEQALATYAWEEALTQFQRALNAKEGQPMDNDKAAALFGLARAQTSTLERHQSHQAADTAVPAFDYYLETGDATHALEIAEYPFRLNQGQSNPFPSRALCLVPADSHQAARLLYKHGESLAKGMADYEGALEACTRALAIAQREEDLLLEFHALEGLSGAYASQIRWAECLEFGLRALELTRRIDVPEYAQWIAHERALEAYIALGDLGGARRMATAMLALTGHDRSEVAGTPFFNGWIAEVEGDWKTARAFYDRALAVSSQDFRPLSQRAVLEYQVGDTEQGKVYLKRFLETVRGTTPGPYLEYAIVPLVAATVARITGEIEHFQMAEEASRFVLSSPNYNLRTVRLVRAGLGLIAVQRGDVAGASEQYAAMKSYPRKISNGGSFGCSVDRVLGLLAHTMGMPDVASGHFEDALGFCRKSGYWPELAWTCHDYAAMIVGAGLKPTPTNAHQKVMSLLDEAFTISTELGMKPLETKLTALRACMDSKPLVPDYPKGLTEREVEVLRLAAQGSTNREIADALFISARTVQQHIRNIYNKIDVRNRAEATAFAINHLDSLK